MGPKKKLEIPRGPVRSGSPASQNLAPIVTDAERMERRANAAAAARKIERRNETIVCVFGSVALLGSVYALLYLVAAIGGAYV